MNLVTENFELAARMIKKAQNILLIPHAKMDCDGMSSAIALYQVLQKMGKNPTAVCPDPVPEAFQFLPSTEIFETEISDKTPENKSCLITLDATQKKFSDLKYEVKDGKVNILIFSEDTPFEETDFTFMDSSFQPDLIIALDSGDIQQLGKIYNDNTELFTSVPILNIDHHISNTQFGTVNLVEMKNSSTTEIVYDLLPYLDERGYELVTEDIATLLLAGLITDTGSFQHSNTTPKALDTAAELIELGARQQEIIKHLFKTKSLATLRLWGKVLTKLQNDPMYRMVWSSISASDLQETISHSDDSEGLIDELLATTPGTEIVLLVKEREDGVISTSVRTSSSLVDATEFASKFGGGGHRQAAGFKIRERAGKSFEEIVSDIIFEAKSFQSNRLELPEPVANISAVSAASALAAQSQEEVPEEKTEKVLENIESEVPLFTSTQDLGNNFPEQPEQPEEKLREENVQEFSPENIQTETPQYVEEIFEPAPAENFGVVGDISPQEPTWTEPMQPEPNVQVPPAPVAPENIFPPENPFGTEPTQEISPQPSEEIPEIFEQAAQPVENEIFSESSLPEVFSGLEKEEEQAPVQTPVQDIQTPPVENIGENTPENIFEQPLEQNAEPAPEKMVETIGDILSFSSEEDFENSLEKNETVQEPEAQETEKKEIENKEPENKNPEEKLENFFQPPSDNSGVNPEFLKPEIVEPEQDETDEFALFLAEAKEKEVDDKFDSTFAETAEQSTQTPVSAPAENRENTPQDIVSEQLDQTAQPIQTSQATQKEEKESFDNFLDFLGTENTSEQTTPENTLGNIPENTQEQKIQEPLQQPQDSVFQTPVEAPTPDFLQAAAPVPPAPQSQPQFQSQAQSAGDPVQNAFQESVSSQEPAVAESSSEEEFGDDFLEALRAENPKLSPIENPDPLEKSLNKEVTAS
jgi:phosphoesterase RecJ-like protein